MTRLRVRHVTGFSYPGEVSASYNEARMLPVHEDAQVVLSARLRVEPVAVSHEYTDYWGTRVASFEVLGPHRQLSLTATSVVEVGERPQPSRPIDAAGLARLAATATAFVEQLRPTPSTTASADLVALAERIRDRHRSPAEAALAIATEIGERMEYRQGVTSVRSTAVHAWEAGAGVCQDIAHVTIAALRSIDVPARYVSGYLHPRPSAAVGETVLGESHAWVEWLTDAAADDDDRFVGCWTGFDPTNGIPIGDRHVVVGRGRDYTDVPPLRGVYAGAGSAELFVSVELTRES
ncbi:transglutaminase family protein [Curtobacterium sp. Leaf261]|uniref:transglutaminase family protein n=1 Tax=Curtobacterium sp. Leaf261 TaxID=1736311 RepID=UPI000700720C|nr:transglutaminase family protein [Curtobacterium sp. Leaf261]KQO60300.1 transglutaminase [Curtobacterium sp. Leaf261]